MAKKLGSAELDLAIEQYDRDGATVLRGIVDPEWISRLSVAIDDLLKSERGMDFSAPGEGRFFGDLFSWLHQPEFKAFIFESGLAEVAGKMMRSQNVRFFYDQLLVKEAKSSKRTPWHQDLPYWPGRGDQIISLCFLIDPASPENGVVTYVRGSHKWNSFFMMEDWTASGKYNLNTEDMKHPVYDDPNRTGLRSIPDIRDHPENYEFITWNVEPGDIIVHHALTVHGAPGNLSADKRRRALALRWFGDDARWDDTRPNFMRNVKEEDLFPYPQLSPGDALDDPLFPKLWSRAEEFAA